MPVHTDMSDRDYFAHPALSHSDTKLILDSPARYRHLKDNPDRPYRPEFEWGHVVHELALGKGAGIDVIDADDWRTKAAKEARDAALAGGVAPILRHDYDAAVAAVAAIMAHPLAGQLLGHLDHAEVAAIWDDGDVPRKAKLDAICGRFGIDVKTTVNAATEAFGRSAGTFAYHSQDAWYRDALRDAFGIADPKFLFVVVEKHPPYLVNVIELDPYAVELGNKRNRRAIDLYRQCRDSGDWPGYGTGINQAQLPRWAEITEETAA
jgi:hypothetical protein